MKFHRYHRFQDGQKIVKRFEIDEVPDPSIWTRGHGPYSAEALINVIAGAKKKFCGVPKSDSQKAKMREAKLGVKKSPEHIQAMRLAQQRRHYGPNANNRSNLE
jgi:hypothetical protein